MEETFQIRNQAGGWRTRKHWAPEAESLQLKTLLSWVPLANVKTVTEIGAEKGHRGIALLQNLAPVANYVGFTHDVGAITPLSSQAELRPVTPTGGLSLANNSQDLFLSIFALENLRMDHLYMALSEARRVVKLDGYAALLAWGPGETIAEKATDWYCQKLRGENPLRLDHYLSPEDWDVVKEGRDSAKGRRVQLMLLRRRDAL